MSARQGLVNVIGTIDSSYRGELGAIVYNLNPALVPQLTEEELDHYNMKVVNCFYNKNAEVIISPGDRIAQLIVSNIIKPEIVEVEELSETSRGINGFGSSGVK